MTEKNPLTMEEFQCCSQCEYFNANLIDEDRVFKLSSSAIVLCSDSPTILQDLNACASLTYTRLYGENHAGQHQTGIVVESVVDVGRAVERPANAVPAKLLKG